MKKPHWAPAVFFAILLICRAESQQGKMAAELFPEIEISLGDQHDCVERHLVVYDEPGRYAGWPANGGFWMRGDRMAVSFECGWFKDKPDWEDGHARDYTRGNEDIVAHSHDGMVFAPAYEITLPELRDLLPDDMPIRRYPDITHTKNSQYPVLDWDPAFQKTLSREPINPRPIASVEIFKYAPCRNSPPLDSLRLTRDLHDHFIGFISYSEGFNDDINKVIWSGLAWDPGIPVEDILSEYARYLIGPDYEESFATGILMLEQNWEGSLKDNVVVYKTLKHFRELENRATMQVKLNPRFQAALYRAYYDANIKARLSYETNLEDQAINVLKTAPDIGSFIAIERAEEILQKAAVRVKPEWRARIFELAEALFQSIRMQLSVPKYHAKEVNRGANLDLIDVPLNNSRQLCEVFNNT